MQTIPYPVYYVLVVNDGEILAGHYCPQVITLHRSDSLRLYR
jgi:hypothetical protein